jgi:hypothetical protein
MEISDVRRRVHATIEGAKKQAADRRARSGEATRAFEVFLANIGVPMFRQVANVLRSDGYLFSVFTPSGSVRLAADRVAEDFIELMLDTTGDTPQVLGHSSRIRGRRIVESERAIGDPATLTEEDVLGFLLKELEAFVER